MSGVQLETEVDGIEFGVLSNVTTGIATEHTTYFLLTFMLFGCYSCRGIRECICNGSACLLSAGDNPIGSHKVGWQLEGIKNGAITCNRDDHIATPGLPDIIIHNDADIGVALPVRACQRDSRPRGIIDLVAGYGRIPILNQWGCSGAQWRARSHN